MSTTTYRSESLSQVRAEHIRWLWPSYIPRGKLVILDGDPGVGKSLLTLDLAARLSRGGALPDGTPSGRPHVALLLSAEDRVADTIQPRAAAAGADLDRLIVVAAADGGFMRFPADLAQLETIMRERHADLVVIDPVMAFLPPEVAANSDQCVRGVLDSMSQLAERTDCTILLVRHLRKKGAAKALHRGLGSVGIIGAMRAGLLAAVHPTDPTMRVLAVTKSNLACMPPALGFRLRTTDSAGVGIEWTGPLDLSADALGFLVNLRPRDRAADWLHRELANGPRKASELLAAAADEGIPERTLNRAKQDARIKSHRHHTKQDERIWYWYDPAVPWPKNAPFKRPDPNELPPLDALL